jgi:hypothetical protein
MAYFAKLENNTVTQVIAISNDICGEPTLQFPETESYGCAFITDTLKLDGVWKQTSFNNNFRKTYAGIGCTYDAIKDQFVVVQPYASWSLDANNDWQAPTPKPEGNYMWDEETLAWVAAPVG